LVNAAAANAIPSTRGNPKQTAKTTGVEIENEACPLETALNFRNVNNATMVGAKNVQIVMMYMMKATTRQPESLYPPLPVALPRESPWIS